MASPSPSPSLLRPPEVPMELHAKNRDKLVGALRRHLADASRAVRGFVFLQGGDEQTRYCTDHTELFRQESYFAYLFGVREPGFFGAIDIASGQSFLFIPRLPAEYAVWMGEIKPLSYFKERYMVDIVFYVDEIVQVLHDHSGESDKPLLYLLHGLNTDSNNFSKPAVIQEMEKFDTDLTTLHPILTECRVIKTDMELALIQYANDISSEAHIEVMRKVRPGMKEYQLESIFLHHTYMYGGCRHCSYTCICATGESSAVLHYGHAAAPNDRVLEDGDMALLDMGGEYHFYGSDITCSFPVNGKFTKEQAIIYNGVLKAHDAVISSMQPGVSWIEMHKLAEKTILKSLKEEGIILGDIDDMMSKRMGALFMPHGLGHFLGIDTHDPGGYAKGMERPKEPGLRSLRTIRELQEGMLTGSMLTSEQLSEVPLDFWQLSKVPLDLVEFIGSEVRWFWHREINHYPKEVITVEPGCYFIDALLVPAMEDSITASYFNREKLDKYKNFGGVRIESDLYVTANGCKNLTDCPRETWEIEAVMAGARWPLDSTSVKSKTENSSS